MAFYLGTHGNIRLRRGTEKDAGNFNATISPDDINTTLNRLGVDQSIDNLITGDRVVFTTTDNRRLDFIPDTRFGELEFLQTEASDQLITQSGDSLFKNGLTADDFTAYVNVNAVGGLRLYPAFADAINDERTTEIALDPFTDGPINVNLAVRDTRFDVLGNVTRYEFNTSRDAIDATALSDKYKQQFNAGLLSGSGRIECAFDYTTTASTEPPVVMLQTIQRLDAGCAFDLALYLTDKEVVPTVDNVFYLTTAVTTSTGISVEAGGLVNCTVDFVTTGQIRLVIGRPVDYILRENNGQTAAEPTLDDLLQEITD
jgi:hypothetical protein